MMQMEASTNLEPAETCFFIYSMPFEGNGSEEKIPSNKQLDQGIREIRKWVLITTATLQCLFSRRLNK